MVGGTTSGYCAIGSLITATPPMIRMTIERTVAKMGRSMKKRENIPASLRVLGLRGRLGGLRARLPLVGLGQHGLRFGIHGGARPRALDAVHDHQVLGPDALFD